MKKISFSLLLLCYLCNVKAQVIDIEKLPKAKKFGWSGSVGGNTNFYNTTSAEKRSNPLSWNLDGNVNFNVAETFDLPFSYTVGKYQSSFTKPYLQFGITPTYKWAKLHLGHRNITFNPYTLAGHTFLGAGVELNPKKWRFAAMYGRLRKAVEIDTTFTSGDLASFKRTGCGAKIGYGTEANYIDLMYFKGKDDANSITSWNDQNIKNKFGDAHKLLPGENTVLGISGKATIRKKLTLNVDGGLSFYQANTTDSLKGSVAKIDFKKKMLCAGKAGMGYTFTNMNLRFDYERITPDYISYGAYFFDTDIENITVSPSGTLAKGKLVYALSAGRQRNNLDKTKTEFTRRFIANANVSVNPTTKWGVDMNYNNFAINQVSGTQPLNDSIRIRQVNQTITLTPHFTFAKDTMASHTIALTGNYNDVNDRNMVTRIYGNMQAMMLALNHTSSFIRSGNSINTGLNYNLIKMALAENKQIGATLGYTQNFFKDALNINATVNYNKSYIDKVSDGNVINGSATLGYTFAKRHNLSFTYNIIKTTSLQYESYTEMLGSLAYTVRIK